MNFFWAVIGLTLFILIAAVVVRILTYTTKFCIFISQRIRFRWGLRRNL